MVSAPAALAAKSPIVQLSGNFAGVATTNAFTGDSTSSFSGVASQLKAFSGISDATFTPTSAAPVVTFTLTGGTATVVTAKGDLFESFTGSGVSNAGNTQGTNLVTIIGGTGSFTGAGGFYMENYHGTVALAGANLIGPFSGTLMGQIIF
jgi:hypothetical protein